MIMKIGHDRLKRRPRLLPAFILTGWLGLMVCGSAAEPSASQRVAERPFPSVFQAWNPIDMPANFPLNTVADRLNAAAKHDVLWEEPVSQLGLGVKLVLGAVWDGKHAGTASRFTQSSLTQALENRRQMLRLNPHMVLLMEVRWRDAPGSFLPEDSPFWKSKDGQRIMGWNGGNEPYYLLDYENPDFAANIARQCKYAITCGVYDGVMFDWHGHLPIIKKVREIIGPEGLILVNIQDTLEKGREYQDYINGSFMECNPGGLESSVVHGSWTNLMAALDYFEAHFQTPRINCVEVVGDRKDLRRMRAATTLTLTHSDGSVLYGDPDDLPTPDHLHDWYTFWDQKIGRSTGKLIHRTDGASQREFQGATVVFNPPDNRAVKITFEELRQRASDGVKAKSFEVDAGDGDMFLKGFKW